MVRIHPCPNFTKTLTTSVVEVFVLCILLSALIITDGVIISGNMFRIRVITNFRAYLGLVTNGVIISGSPF